MIGAAGASLDMLMIMPARADGGAGSAGDVRSWE